MQYEHFGHQGQRTSKELTDTAAAMQIGKRAMIGFDMIHRYVTSPDGSETSVVYFQSEITGKLWALYF